MTVDWPLATTLMVTVVTIASFIFAMLRKDNPWASHLSELENKTTADMKKIEETLSKEVKSLADQFNDEKRKNHTNHSVMENKIEDIGRRIEELKEAMSSESVGYEKDYTKLEEKVEKLTDIMIDFIRQYSNRS